MIEGFVNQGISQGFARSFIGNGGGAPFSPLDLSSLLGWWDASDASTISEDTAAGRVSQWDDKSGNDQHLKSTVSTRQPITGSETLNGMNVLTGLGAADETVLDTIGNQTGSLAGIDAEDFEVHIVFEQEAGQSTEALICVKSSFGGDIIVGDWRTGSGTLTPRDGTNYNFAGAHFPRGTAALLGFGITATELSIRNNGVEVDSIDPLAGASSAFDRFLVFCRAGGTNKFYGFIAEIVVTGRLSDADRILLEGYLMNKWGL